MAIREELVRFVEASLLRGEGRIEPDESLIDRGIIDSVGLIQLMTFLEERTGIRIPDHYVTPENFQSVEAMERMLVELRRV